MMDSAFHFAGTVSNFLFKGWTTTSAAGFAGVCIFVAALTFLIEGLKLSKTRLWRVSTRNPLAAAPSSEVEERPATVRALMIPSSLENIRRKKIQVHCGLTLIHVVELVAGYFVMLAVMSFNTYIGITVITASGLGYYLIGWLRTTHQPITARRDQRTEEISDITTTSHLLAEDGGNESINGTAAVPPPCHTPSEQPAQRVTADVHL